jgi:hypothetical protein
MTATTGGTRGATIGATTVRIVETIGATIGATIAFSYANTAMTGAIGTMMSGTKGAIGAGNTVAGRFLNVSGTFSIWSFAIRMLY